MPSSSACSVTRRSFLQRTSLAAAAFTLLPERESRAADPLKIGLIGCGGRGRGAALNAMESSSGVEVVALADIFEDRLEAGKKAVQGVTGKDLDSDLCFLGWDSYRGMMSTDIDIVILATPPCFRADMLEAAIEAGKHVFMEKPASVDPPGIRRIIAAGENAKKKGLCIAAGTQRRHDLKYQATIDHIRDGAIGDIVAARAYWCGGPIGFHEQKEDWSDMEYQMRNWYHFLWLSGDHIVEQHVHNIDVINWAVGAHPVKAFGVGGRAWQAKGNIWDHHAVDFEYGNGVHLASYARQIANSDDNVSEFVVGTKGSSNCATWIGTGEGEWKYSGKVVNPYVQEHADLIDAIRSGKQLNEARNVAESTMTAIMGRMAGYSGKVVTWDEALNSGESLALEKIEFGPVRLRPVAIPGGKPYAGEGWKAG